MCLTVENKYHPKNKPLVAEQDIYTLKISRVNDDDKPIAYFKKCEQKYGLLPRVKIDKNINFFDEIKIHTGYHSLLTGFTISIITDYFDCTESKKIIILCRIPKGTKYYIGNNNDIVSERLELIQPIICNKSYYKKMNKPSKYYVGNTLYYNYIHNKIFKRCVKHCKEAGYKIGL